MSVTQEREDDTGCTTVRARNVDSRTGHGYMVQVSKWDDGMLTVLVKNEADCDCCRSKGVTTLLQADARELLDALAQF